jgi:hemerythrin
MSNIVKKNISTGVTWIAIEEADLYLCCGCPADTIKHLKKEGILESFILDGFPCENGPNAILLSDTLIQNGQVANLTEFPILQMLYLQGMNLPNHPNYKKSKPLLIGYEKQIKMQLGYISIGNHGLSSIDEIMEAGIEEENAKKIFATKLHYSGGKISSMNELIDTLVLEDSNREVRNNVFIKRLGINWFEISYKDEKTEINLNIREDEHYEPPYKLPFKKIHPGEFSITHSGEGNGWDENRPCMASVIHYKNRIYIIDAGPNILNNLSRLGIGLSEIDGIFLSHIHDDHFAGITELLNVERKLNFYSTKLVRQTAEKKLKALMNSELDLVQVAFNCLDLELDLWNDVNGLEVKPIYSPHTVETTTFQFRAYNGEEYKTYSHLSDTINLHEFELIVNKFPDIFSEQDIDFVKDNYLSKVDLKKIDVGGGPIHGHLSDYYVDQSDIKVMAHTTKEIDAGKNNFINVEFGQTHTLVEEEGGLYLKTKTITFLSHYFNMLEKYEIESLSTQKIKHFKPGEHIISKENSSKIYLIISGLVSFINQSGMDQTLDAGNFIGYSRRYFRDDLPEEYISWSHVYCMEYEESFLNRFILKYRLVDDLKSRIQMMRSLRKSTIINDLLSNSIMNRLSKYAELVTFKEHQFNDGYLLNNLLIITKGKVTVEFDNGNLLRIGAFEHFGGNMLIPDYRRNQKFIIDDDVEVIAIPASKIDGVPKLLWRLLELEEKRYQVSIFIAN